MQNVSVKNTEVAELHKSLAVIEALLGGTKAMRKAGKTYLFQQKLESDEAYKARLERATLYPALSETLSPTLSFDIATGAEIVERTWH